MVVLPLHAFREVMEKSGRDPREFALHSLRIGGASTLAPGRDVSDWVIHKGGRWRSEELKTHIAYNVEDAKRVSRELSDEDIGVERLLGEGTVCGSLKRKRISRSSAGDRVFGG